MRAIFMRDGRVFTTGFTKRSERQYSLRDEVRHGFIFSARVCVKEAIDQS